ncbi:hypothetical protein L1987_40188 [Smallanthus sonchifolius]|uniref:Uncharacterized protein n=1 Tax=Smallanthus sonchifolius TaxID=185202 RepID=A0ACB9GSK1_9ASTR|nr:hypothetical protein L1987_40188 [Smallanthus sonchifolius]
MESFLWTMARFKFFMLLLFLSMSLRDIRSAAQLLPDEEVETMQLIASKLQYSGWSVARDSCSRGFGLNNTISQNKRGLMQFGSNVTCNCTSTVCHISTIVLSRNYINGTIPARFSQLRVSILSLLGNRISGPIPEEIGDIFTLEELVLENNLLGGPLPKNLGRLPRLRRFLVSANNFTGTIPESFGNLTNLEDFRIDGSSLSGCIPDFIGNWTNLTRLDLQGTPMEGPIPSTISLLTNLKELRITDMAGASSSGFPDLEKRTKMTRLSLRNCLLTGSIPGYIGQISDLNHMNLVSALSTSATTNKSLFIINCGGTRTDFANNEYEEDLTSKQSYFYSIQERWAYSTNGLFMGNDDAPFIATSSNVRGGDIYRTARASPTSLRYYGLCLRKGSYKVRLHFAEISYTDNMTFSSLGRRYFDISIQGILQLKDFNIAEKANGVGKGIFVDFDNVMVNGSTLDIHLYWAGKGTTAIPDRAGIVIGSCTFTVLILAVLWKKAYLGGDKEDKGGFGPVYKGVLSDGSEIAVKQLSARSKQGNREFVTEIGMISALHHPNLVKLYGCCIEGKELLLIYEYLENNCLARALFGRDDQKLNLDWSRRKKICMGIARENPKTKAYVLQDQGSLLELVDPSLGRYSKEEAMRMLNLALLCTNPSPTLRPPMSAVVKMLDGKMPVQPPMVKRGADMRFKAFDLISQDSQTHVSTISAHSLGPRSISTDAPWTGSSIYKDETKEDSPENKLLPDLYVVDI